MPSSGQTALPTASCNSCITSTTLPAPATSTNAAGGDGPHLAPVDLQVRDLQPRLRHLGLEALARVFRKVRRVAVGEEPQLAAERWPPVAVEHRHANEPAPGRETCLHLGQELDPPLDVLEHVRPHDAGARP